MKQFTQAAKELARMDGIIVLQGMADEIKKEFEEHVKWEGDLGKLAYDTGHAAGLREGMQILIDQLEELATSNT